MQKRLMEPGGPLGRIGGHLGENCARMSKGMLEGALGMHIPPNASTTHASTSVLETLPDLKILGLTILVPSRPLASLASRLRTLRVPCEATVQEDSQRTSGAPNYPQLLRTPRVPRSPASRKIEQILRTLRDPRKS